VVVVVVVVVVVGTATNSAHIPAPSLVLAPEHRDQIDDRIGPPGEHL